jgi:hypothetical protein
MKTSSFFKTTGEGRISIARFAPRNIEKGYREFRALAPGRWFKTAPKEEYRKLYLAEILAPLDPRRTYDELCELAGSAEPVLLCWERPPLTETNWCHRRLVAEWIKRTLGIDVPEAEPRDRQLSLLRGER